MNFSFIDLFIRSSWLVQIVMLGLMLNSILSWAIIFNRNRVLTIRLKSFNKFQMNFNSSSEILHLYKQISAQKNKIGVELMFFKGFSEFLYLTKNNYVKTQTILKEVNRIMEIVFYKEQELLEKNLATLATIQSISPYIGLFGTIWGILSVFHQLGTASGQATLAVVAPGISEALVATGLGLFVAIPAGIFYNKFTAKIDYLLTGYHRTIQELINLVGKKLYIRHQAQSSNYHSEINHEVF